MMDKRDRLARTLAGEPTDRPPVSMWRPFPGDDQRSADFAGSVIDFQQRYDWDFVNVYPSPNFMVIDYGMQDEWQGAADGTRTILKRPVRRSLDWTELRALDPYRGELGKQLMALKLVQDALGPQGVPVIQTVYSPLSQAAKIAGHELLLRHLRRNPDRLSTGLNLISESTMRFVEALRQSGIAGIYYVIDYADYTLLSEPEYQIFGLTHDLKVLSMLASAWWLNLVYLKGNAPMFRLIDHLPPLAVNWQDQTAEPNMADGKLMLKSAAVGGLDATGHLVTGTPSIIRDVIRAMFKQMNQRRLILSTGGPLLATTPHSNLRAVRDAVESAVV
jgi:uroporphyrinogen decarboxylase